MEFFFFAWSQKNCSCQVQESILQLLQMKYHCLKYYYASLHLLPPGEKMQGSGGRADRLEVEATVFYLFCHLMASPSRSLFKNQLKSETDGWMFLFRTSVRFDFCV